MDEINSVLNQIADNEIEAKNEFEYEQMMDNLMEEYLHQMAAANSYDMDAVYYGMEGVK